MKDSNMTDEWIKAQWARNPCKMLDNGDIRTGPVRLSYPYLLKPSKPTKDKPEGGYGAVLLFPPGVDLSVLKAEMQRVAKETWPTAGTPGGPKMFNPIRDQDLDGDGDPGVSERKAGYEKGAMRIGANSNQKVVCVDARMSPIVDEARIYPGVWAICTLRCYPFGKDSKAKKRGPTFGLQAVMIVADDDSIGGAGAANPNEAFAGVSIDPGDINADAAFGEGQAQTAEAASLFD